MITVVDLNYSHNIYPLISQQLIDAIEENLLKKKKILVFLNRRWESSAYFCRDCSYQFKCKNCDISLAVHSYPNSHLLCHQCGYKEQLPMVCPKCGWTNMIWIWVWTQKIEENLGKIFKNNTIIRLDGDKINSEWLADDEIKNWQIFIATEIVNTITFDNIWLVAVILLESELVIPDYNIEEKIYWNIAYNIKKWSDSLIQTFSPKLDLIKLIVDWNYKDFFTYTLQERLKYWYPPYTDFVEINIKSYNKDKIFTLSTMIKNKLKLEYSDLKIDYDNKVFRKFKNEFIQKISVRWDNLEEKLKLIKQEILRNREIRIEWKQ